MEKQRYRKGAHTTLDLKYHCVWKTKYGYPVLRGEVSLGAKRIKMMSQIQLKYEMRRILRILSQMTKLQFL